MNAPHRTVSVSTLRVVLSQARELGLDPDRVLAEASVPVQALDDVDGRAALESFDALVQAVEALSGDPHFGLRVGTRVSTQEFGCLHYLLANSDTLGQCMERLCRYSRLVGDGVALELEPDGEHAWLRVAIAQSDSRSPEAVRYSAETWLSALARFGTAIAGDAFHITRLLLPPQCPRQDAIYREVFRAPPELALERPAIRFPARTLETRMPNADPRLSQVMSSHANQLMGGLPRLDDLRDAVGKAIERELADGTMTLDRVAHRLAMSPRSLQRRLREAGLGFRDLLDEVRRRRAREYLKDRSISVDETAFLLGFSNASAFGRACRRWTRRSPREYRAHLLAERSAKTA